MDKPLQVVVLERQVAELQRRFALMHQVHMMTLTVLVHYIGGEVTLSADDYTAAQGVLLTEELNTAAKQRTLRTRRIGQDGGDELARGGLLPPDAGQHHDA